MSEPLPLASEIVAVAVYPDQARVTRRGRIEVPAGQSRVSVDGLPLSLLTDSIRVAGRGAARITGVDVTRRFHERAPDQRVATLQQKLDALQRERRVLDDERRAQEAVTAFLDELSRRAGFSFGQQIASGDAAPAAAAEFTESLAAQLRSVHERMRSVDVRRVELEEAFAAVVMELDGLRQQAATERFEAVVSLEADATTTVELELTTVMVGAGWHPVYDCRLGDDDLVQLSWQGVINQTTGEDWPECEVTLSTARPAASATVPELDPWFVDAWQPPPMPVMARSMAAPAPAGMAGAAGAQFEMAKLATDSAAPIEQSVASAEEGRLATSFRLPRPLAVLSDGSPHKATIAEIALDADLDFLTVPKLAPEAYLRATVTNSSALTLLPGPASIFHGADFVGTTHIELTAPGATFELQLGIDDRIAVERELVKRSTSKTLIGGNRRTAVAYRITVENHRNQRAKVTVSDQFPVSRHESVKVRDTEAKPAPTERTDLDVVTWTFELASEAEQELTISFELEHPKDLRLTGWTD